MASTFTDGSKVASTVQARAGIDITAVYGTYEVAVQVVVNDVYQMVKIPKGATVLEVINAMDDMDGGSASVHDVGDGTTSGRFISGSTIAQGGGVVRLGQGITGATAADCLNYAYTAEDTIDIKFTTAPASTGTGTMKLAVIYTMNS